MVSETFKDAGRTASATRVFECVAQGFAPADEALSASAGGVEVPGDDDSFSATRVNCRVTDRNVERKTPSHFTVTIEYSDPTSGKTEKMLIGADAGIDESKEVMWVEYAMDESDPPKPVRTAAGEPFEQGPQRPVSIKVFNYTKYVNAATKANLEAADDTVNAGSISIKGKTRLPDTCWLDVSGFEQVGANTHKATYQIKYNRRGWIDRPLHIGHYELIDGKPQPIPDALGGTIGKGWPLNENGTRKTNITDTPETLLFRPFAANAWSGVPLS